MGEQSRTIPALGAGERALLIIPWLFGIGVSSWGAFTLEGIDRAFAVGGFAAFAGGSLLAITQLRRSGYSLRMWFAERESDLSMFADDRAAAVVRQFSWAVDELVAVRAELRTVEARRAEAEELAAAKSAEAERDADELLLERQRIQAISADAGLARQQLEETEGHLRDAEARIVELTDAIRDLATTMSAGEQRPGASVDLITLDWTLEYDGRTHSLRLRCTSPGVRPSRARVVDADGRPIARSLPSAVQRPRQLTLRIPQSVAAAVESGDWSAFRVEVLVGRLWRGATIVDRGEAAADQHTRASRSVKRPTPIRIVS